MSREVTRHEMDSIDSDEEDGDYVPPAENGGAGSDSEDSGEEGKETGPSTNPQPPLEDPEEQKRARDALWESFQQSVAQKVPEKFAQPEKMVKVEKRYRFAGEDVVQVVEVPENSADAKKWPLWTEPEVSHDPNPPISSTSTSPGPNLSAPVTATAPSGSTDVPSPVAAKPPAKRPGPRKPKTTLAAIPSSKAKKLSTLDKSAMDWKAHVQAEQQAGSTLKDELEANKRSGGYLEKVEFLQRVEERREENLELAKSNKRRKM